MTNMTNVKKCTLAEKDSGISDDLCFKLSRLSEGLSESGINVRIEGSSVIIGNNYLDMNNPKDRTYLDGLLLKQQKIDWDRNELLRIGLVGLVIKSVNKIWSRILKGSKDLLKRKKVSNEEKDLPN